MTKDEKDLVDTETSQTDVLVDSQPQVEHEGQQNQPAVNLPQLSAQSEAGSSQAGGHAEVNVNIIEEEKEDLMEELPGEVSTAVEPSSTEAESLSISTRIRIYKHNMIEHFWLYFDRLCNEWPIAFVSSTVGFASLLFGTLTFPQYLDFFMLTLTICVVTLLLPCVERASGYSLLRKCMESGKCVKVDEPPCPCKSKPCNHGKSSRSRSRPYRRPTETRFEHEVADPSSGKAPEILYVEEDIEHSYSTERPESPKAVNVDVYSNIESPGCSGESFVIPPTNDSSVRSKTTPFHPRPPSPSDSV